MAIAIEQVTHWTRPFRSVGCVVVSDLGGFVVTACRSMQSGDAVAEPPPKVCRKCRAELKSLNLKEKAA